MAKDDERPVLTGVLFQPRSDGKLELIGTDGWRMHITSVDMLTGPAGPVPQCLLDAKALKKAKLNGHYDLLAITLRDDALSATVSADGRALAEVSNIQSSYPSYRQLVPQQWTWSVTLDVDEALSLLDPVFRAAKQESKEQNTTTAPVRLYADDKGVRAQAAETEAVIPAVVQGEGKISFNAVYLHDVLRAVPHARLTLRASAAKSAGLFQERETGFTALIMPMFVEW